MDIRRKLFGQEKSDKNTKSTLPPIAPLPIFLNESEHFFQVAPLYSDDKNYINHVVISPHNLNPSETYLIKLFDKKCGAYFYYPVLCDEKIRNKNQIKMSMVLRNRLNLGLNERIEAELINKKEVAIQPAQSLAVEILKPISHYYPIEIKTDTLLSLLLDYSVQQHPLSPGQYIVIPYHDGNQKILVECRITHINENQSNNKECLLFNLNPDSKVEFTLGEEAHDISLYVKRSAKTINLDFESAGIGGQKNQLEQLIREGFYTRAMPSHFTKAYGVKHINKGILLYGPPGTGKTLIARVIAEKFNPDKVKLVNGPELKSKYVGESAENVRRVFREAEMEWRERGEESDLHVIIFDEIDALFAQRGSRSGETGVNEDLVAQILTILDGVDSPQNILVIGTTNRIDLLDSALLRHGRLGVQIEVGLPDEASRLSIIRIHTKTMLENGLLDESVDLHQLAKETKNFTPAEIEQVISKARQYAMANNFDNTEGQTQLVLKDNIKSVDHLEKVYRCHFDQALSEITPLFGIKKTHKNTMEKDFILYDKDIEKNISNFKSALAALNNKQSNSLQFIISGKEGTGKTKLALHLAKLTGSNYVKVLSPDNFLSLSLEKQLQLLENTFNEAKCTDFSVIILDELENLLLADAESQSYNNHLRIKYERILKTLEESDNKCIVIATTSNLDFIKRVKLFGLFNESIRLNSIRLPYQHKETCFKILSQFCAVFGYEIAPFSASTSDYEEIDITINELIYQIKKFCSGGNALEMDALYYIIQESRERNSIQSSEETCDHILSELSLFSPPSPIKSKDKEKVKTALTPPPKSQSN